MGRDPGRDTRQGWVFSRLPGNGGSPAPAIRQAHPRAQSRQIWWLRCPGNVMPMWAASSFLSPLSLASGLGGSALSTNSTRSKQSLARRSVACLPRDDRPGPAACQGHGHFPSCMLSTMLPALLETPSPRSSPSASPSRPPPDFPNSQRGAQWPRHPRLPTPPALLHLPATERGGRAPGEGVPDPPGTWQAAAALRGWIRTTWDGKPCSSKALAILAC